jgi:hypothetical protein
MKVIPETPLCLRFLLSQNNAGWYHRVLWVFSGFGAAISYATILISVRKYFDKKLLIAMPLATIGGSINVIAFPPTIRWILGTYGLSGGLLIMSAILLNNVVCGSVVFPLQKKCKNSFFR